MRSGWRRRRSLGTPVATDCVAVETTGLEATYVGFGDQARDEDEPADARRLDSVFSRVFETRRYVVHAGNADGNDGSAERSSDHRPVVVDLCTDC